MVDADRVRLGRIAGKLAAARAVPLPPGAFGAQQHRFRLGDSLPEAVVAAFEERHEVALPAGYRLFVTELGDGGAGPGYRLSSLSTACYLGCPPGHLARPSPYLPGPRYPEDWEQRHEEPPGPDRAFLPGTLTIAHHGCTLVTQLVVTGPARGRLLNLDYDGSTGPYVVEDASFLAWYERWLDEAISGRDVGWFGERLPLDEPWPKAGLPDLLSELAADDLERRRLAAYRLADLAWRNAWTPARGPLGDAAARLLDDADPLLRLHGVTVVRRAHLVSLEPRLRQLEKTEADPWVRFELGRQPPSLGGSRSPAAQGFAGELPF